MKKAIVTSVRHENATSISILMPGGKIVNILVPHRNEGEEPKDDDMTISVDGKAGDGIEVLASKVRLITGDKIEIKITGKYKL